MRAFARLWDRLARERYGVEDPRLRRFRYGVQVNSLGLTARQPENNAYRILLEMLAPTLSRDARARAVQLPAWNEALGLPARMGPAMVAPGPADPGVRDRPAGARRPVRGVEGGRGPDGPDRGGGVGRAQAVLDRGGSVEALAYMKERLVGRLAMRDSAPSRTAAGSWSA